MEELVNAIAEISYAVNTTSGWEIAGVVLSAFALLGSLAVLFQNHRTIELSRKDIQNTINLQMFDKMMTIANKIENDDYSITKMEIYTLYGKDIYTQIQKIKDLGSELRIQESNYEIYNRIIEKQGYDYTLANEAAQEDAPEELLRRAEEQDKKFKEVTEGEPDPDGNPIFYNGDEISAEIKRLKLEIENCKKNLKNDVYRITREKIHVEDTTLKSKNSKCIPKIPKFKISIDLRRNKFFPGLIILLAILAIIAYGMFRFGFRITYDPTIITDWNAVSGCAAWASVAVSAVAIWYAIQVPKKIAERQDKIALFEKRYKLYKALNQCIIFSDELHLLMETADDRFEVFCISFDLGFEDSPEKRDKLITKKEYEVASLLAQSEFLFDEVTSKAILNLAFKFVILMGKPHITDSEVEKTKNEYIQCANNIKENIIPLMEKKLSLD